MAQLRYGLEDLALQKPSVRGNTLVTLTLKQRVHELSGANRFDEAKAACNKICRTDPGNAEAWCLLGALQGMTGELEKSLESCQRALVIRPNYPEAHNNTGLAFEHLQRLDKAAAAYREAIHLAPDYADAHFNLGNVLKLLGQPGEAIRCYNKAARIRPNDAEAFANIGATLASVGQWAEAAESYRHATQLKPGSADAYNGLGAALAALGNQHDAIQAYRQALRINPHHALAHNNLGNLLADQNHRDEALVHYREALRSKPDYTEAHYNFGTALYECGQLDSSMVHLREALRLNPGYCEAHNNLGNVLAVMEKPEDAVFHYREAMRLKPCYAEAITNLGNVHQRLQGRMDEGIACHRQAISCDPDYADAHYNLAFCLLLKGEFREGWREYDWRWKRCGGVRRPLPVVTDVANLKGRRVFLHSEQGLGDELFFLRFLPELRRRGVDRIVYRAGAKLVSLLERTPVIDRIANASEHPEEGDLVCAIGDLPLLLGMERIDQIPLPLPLTALAAHRHSMRAQLTALGPPPYIGVSWRAGTPDRKLSLYKACPPSLIVSAFKDIPCTLLVLQRRPAPGEIEAFAQELGRPVHDLSAMNEDLEQMLALLSLIDEYVGVSNTNMHLRAAVGKTAKVLVPAPPEWRWMAEGKESPWFPGFGVYRQKYDGSWDDAFDMLAADLKTSRGT